MKNFLAAVAVALVVAILMFTPIYKIVRTQVQQTELHQIDEHMIEVYNRIADNNRNIDQIHRDYMRVTHYISGHDFRHPTNFCPECGLLEQLDIREEELEKQIVALSEKNLELKKDSDEYKQNVTEINRMTVEQNILEKHLHSADERAKEVNKVMRDKRLVGNQTTLPNKETK